MPPTKKGRAARETGGDGPEPEEPSPYTVLSHDELAIFTHRAEQWKHNPELFEEWQLDRLYIYIQILDKLAVDPPPGRGSGSLVITAIKDVREQASAMSAILAEVRETRRKVRKGQ
jgi:hypothetical protein